MVHGHLKNGDPQPYCGECLIPLIVYHMVMDYPSFDMSTNLFPKELGLKGKFPFNQCLQENIFMKLVFKFENWCSSSDLIFTFDEFLLIYFCFIAILSLEYVIDTI